VILHCANLEPCGVEYRKVIILYMLKKMPPNRFVGLHGHSGCSVFDGMDFPQDHMDYVMENGMDSWSLTDHGHMNGFGYAYLYNEKLKKAGKKFKLITGCEMYVHPDLNQWQKDLEKSRSKPEKDESIVKPLVAVVDGNDETVDIGAEDSTLTIENEDETKSGKYNDPVKRRHHLVVLPKTSVGLQRLFHLVSRGYLEGFYRFPRIDYSMLKEAAKGGHLLISSACLGGALAFDVFEQVQKVPFEELKHDLLEDESLLNRILTSMGNTYDRLADAVGRENVCLELQFNKLSAQHLANRAILEFAKRNSLTDRLVVTCDSHYSRPEHWREREIYKKLGWLNHQNFDPKLLPQSVEDLKCELYPKNATQVWDTFLKTTEGMSFYDDTVVAEAIERTHDIAHNEVQETHPDRSMKLPSYSIPEGMTEDKALVKACMQGLIWRGLDDKPEYIERLKYELKIIKDKKFSNYFLTMKKILDIARENMLLGPGRGCFLPHSRVKMSDGLYAPISTISIGDTVVDAYGNNQKVIDTLTYDVDEELVRLEFEDGKIIECTKDHEILTHNRGWVHAQDINENDDVVEV